MSKFTLTVNSHSLDHYQKCPALYAYTNIMNLESLIDKLAFKKGTEVGRILNLMHYRLKRYRPNGREAINKCLQPVMNPLYQMRRFGKNFDAETVKILMEVINKYTDQFDFENTFPVGVETGFSKIIHEDEENLFIYEGRLDLIVKNKEGEYMVCDNKTQSMRYSIYQHNNQVLGYLWATNIRIFFYNYLLLTKSPEIRREVFHFTESQIEAWRIEVVKWMFRIKDSLLQKDFPLTRQSCQNKYGLCDFFKVCEAAHIPSKEWIIKSEFKVREPYRSWS